MKRSHRVALKPTPEQESLFSQHAGYARFAYNWAVGEFKADMDDGEGLSEKTLWPCWNKVKGIIASWGVALSQNAQVCHQRLWSGVRRLGSASQAREGWRAGAAGEVRSDHRR